MVIEVTALGREWQGGQGISNFKVLKINKSDFNTTTNALFPDSRKHHTRNTRIMFFRTVQSYQFLPFLWDSYNLGWNVNWKYLLDDWFFYFLCEMIRNDVDFMFKNFRFINEFREKITGELCLSRKYFLDLVLQDT